MGERVFAQIGTREDYADLEDELLKPPAIADYSVTLPANTATEDQPGSTADTPTTQDTTRGRGRRARSARGGQVRGGRGRGRGGTPARGHRGRGAPSGAARSQ